MTTPLPADLVTAARQFQTGDAATIQLLGALADALAAQTIAVLQAHEDVKRLRDALAAIAAPGPLEQCWWQTDCARKALQVTRRGE